MGTGAFVEEIDVGEDIVAGVGGCGFAGIDGALILIVLAVIVLRVVVVFQLHLPLT